MRSSPVGRGSERYGAPRWKPSTGSNVPDQAFYTSLLPKIGTSTCNEENYLG